MEKENLECCGNCDHIFPAKTWCKLNDSKVSCNGWCDLWESDTFTREDRNDINVELKWRS